MQVKEISDARVAAQMLLEQQPMDTMKAVWAALQTHSLDVVMVVMLDTRCGIENHSYWFCEVPNLALPIQRKSTPIILAAHANRPDVIAALLEAGADVQASDFTRINAAHVAASNNFHECLKLLLPYPQVLMARDVAGRLPLHKAATFGHSEIIQMLLVASPSSVSVEDNYGSRPMHLAADMGRVEAFKLLDQEWDTTNVPIASNGQTALHLAAMKGRAPMVQWLLSNKAIVDARDNLGNTPLHFAVHAGSVEVTEQLIAARACVTSANNNGTVVASYLILQHADPGNVVNIINVLGQAGADLSAPNSNGDTLLHMAARFHQCEGAKVLINWKSSKDFIDAVNKDGDSALHKVAVSGLYHSDPVRSAAALQIAALLVSAGASTNIVNSNGRTPIMLMSPTHVAFARVLINAGADVDAKDRDHRTTLWRLSLLPTYKGVALLFLSAGASVTAADMQGVTLLHRAVRASNAALVEALLDCGADPEAADNKGLTPGVQTVGFSREVMVWPVPQ